MTLFNWKQVRIRAEQVVLRKGKIRPPRYPTTNRLDVRHLNSFLLTSIHSPTHHSASLLCICA